MQIRLWIISKCIGVLQSEIACMRCIEIYLFPILLWTGPSCSALSKISMSQVLQAWDEETNQISVLVRIERSRGSKCLSTAPGVWLYGSLPMKWGQQREMALDVWVKVALEKEIMQWPSMLRSLIVCLIHPDFHGHIRSCHLTLKECGNLLVVSGLVSLRYS